MSRMIRRIWVKWVLAVLTAVVLPFVAFTYFVDTTVSEIESFLRNRSDD